MFGRIGLVTLTTYLGLAVLGCDRSSTKQPPRPSVPADSTPPNVASPLPDRSRERATEVAPVGFRFAEVAEARGVAFSYHNGASGAMHLWETMGGGVAVLDFDGDGWMDLYFTNGCDDPHGPPDGRRRGRLFRNLGGGEFADATEAAMIDDRGYGQGCAVGDCDNDGFDDLFVSRYGSASLYKNLGDGTLKDITSLAAIRCPLWNTACAFGDLAGSGALDLFVTGYVEIDLAAEPICRDRRGKLAYCGPDNYEGQPFQLWQNAGDGQFRDVSDAAGVVMPKCKGLAAAVLDLDDDGRLDVFVVNDAEPARLLRNLGDGRFEDAALSAGLAYTGDGHVYNGMGIAHGDYDCDGRIDLAVSNFFEKGVVLFQNRGGGSFRDKSLRTGLGPATRPRTSFALVFADVDNDGWPDLFVANGHISDLRADGIPYGMRAQLFHNRQGEGFRDVSDQAGEYFRAERLGRGAAAGDLDNDGGVDVVVSHNVGPIAVLRNETPDRGHFLSVALVGTRSSRVPYGARVIATVGDRVYVQCLGGGGSYFSANDQRILLGLGAMTKVDRIEVRWPSGQRNQWTDVPADRAIRLTEGRDSS